MPKLTDYHFLAGNIVSDGSIIISKNNQLRVNVSMKNNVTIIHLHKIFGGYYYKSNDGMYGWWLNGKKAFNLLKKIDKISIGKINQIELAIKYYKNRIPGNKPPAEYYKMRELKKVYYNST